ncbi:MAG: hypothetical protein J3Q66DRAFT_347134 [Benniella sp.]|nr:MAG: hypothetical protein J3Q66DRAFT_347134 [Benniella sp.]
MNNARLGSFGNERLGNITQKEHGHPPPPPPLQCTDWADLGWWSWSSSLSAVGALLTHGLLQPPCGDSIIIVILIVIVTTIDHTNIQPTGREDDSCECLLLLCVAHCVSGMLFLVFVCGMGCIVECFLHCLCALCACVAARPICPSPPPWVGLNLAPAQNTQIQLLYLLPPPDRSTPCGMSGYLSVAAAQAPPSPFPSLFDTS